MIPAVENNGPDFKSITEGLVEEVSASRLNLWSSCRLKFYFRYVAQIQKSATGALHVGKTVHAVLQAWNMARWRGSFIQTTTLEDLFAQKWSEEQQGQIINWQGKEEKERSVAWGLVGLYLQQTPIPEDEKPMAVEVRLEADLSHQGLPMLIGIVDLVRPGGKIVDFKTSGQTPDPDRVAHQTEIQLTSYGMLFRDATGVEASGFELHHLVKLKAPKLVVTSLPPSTDHQKTRLFRLMESYVDSVQRQDFVPSAGLQCASCQYFNECRRWS